MVAYSFKRLFVPAIKAGLSSVALSFDPRPKLQTIRAIGRRRHARVGAALQLYCGMRSRDCFKIGDARCIAVSSIRVHVRSEIIEIHRVDAADSLIDRAAALDAFAIKDGFESWPDMKTFWLEEHGETTRLGPFVGLLIEWEPLS